MLCGAEVVLGTSGQHGVEIFVFSAHQEISFRAKMATANTDFKKKKKKKNCHSDFNIMLEMVS